MVVQNRRGVLGLGTLNSAVSQELIYEMRWFFVCWYKFKKAKSYFNSYWVGMVRNARDFLDRGTLKSGISHKLFYELGRFVE